MTAKLPPLRAMNPLPWPPKTAPTRRGAGMLGNRKAKQGRLWEDLALPMFSGISSCEIDKTTAPFRITAMITGGAYRGAKVAGFFEKKGQCDFVGRFRGVHVELEAKRHCQIGKPWNFKSAIDGDQMERLSRNRAGGGLSGVLLMSDDGNRLFAISWSVIESAMKRGRKSFSVPDLAQAVDFANDIGDASGVFDLHQRGMAGGMERFLVHLYERREQS